MLDGQPNHGWQLWLPLLLHVSVTYILISIDERVRARCCVCCRAHRIKLLFFSLWYSAVSTVESISLFCLLLILKMYLLGNDTSISKGYFMQTKHLSVLIQIKHKREVGTINISCLSLSYCLDCSLQYYGHQLGKS